jgi:hypothetical protein
MVEYSRTAVIAHISQATKGYQEGWGRPGKSISVLVRCIQVEDRETMARRLRKGPRSGGSILLSKHKDGESFVRLPILL